MSTVQTIFAKEQEQPRRTGARQEDLFSGARAKFGLYAICFGFFLVLLDTTALNVAIGAIQQEFRGKMSGLQWVVNSYSIAFASLLLTCGAVGDRFGARRLYQIGLALFTGMSLLCALSPGVGFLIGARMVQGLGAAMMLPASLSLLSHAFPHPDQRARAVTFWASTVSLGFAAGPALGGVLTNYFGWRSIFWINVPVGLAALWMVRRFVEENKAVNPRHIDWPGQVSICLLLFFLTYGLIEAGNAGWTTPRILWAFGLSILLTIAFVMIERFSSSSVLPRCLFHDPTFSVCVIVGGVLNFGMYGILFIESIYLQNIRHLSALSAGLLILPFTVLPTITGRLIVRYSGRSHIRLRLAIGLLVASLGASAIGLALWSSGYGRVLLGLGLLGIGLGSIMPAMTTGVLSSSTTQMSGVASGILNSARQVGGTMGVALMGTLVQRSQGQGMLWSFALAVVCFLLMAGATLRFIKRK